MGSLWMQLLLQFLTNIFETLQVFLSWSEDMHAFLARLSYAQDELLRSLLVCRPSMRPSVLPLTFSYDFSEAAEPILLKFHMEPP